MTLNQRLNALAQAIGTDIATLLTMMGLLANLTTAAKGNLVAAINELKARADSQQNAFGDLINDAAGQGDTTHVFSADRVLDLVAETEARILGGMAPDMLDTLKELADFLTDNSVANGLVQQLSQRVRIDAAQFFTAEQRTQGRDNIGAAAAADLLALINALGDLDQDLVQTYTTARGAV